MGSRADDAAIFQNPWHVLYDLPPPVRLSEYSLRPRSYNRKIPLTGSEGPDGSTVLYCYMHATGLVCCSTVALEQPSTLTNVTLLTLKTFTQLSKTQFFLTPMARVEHLWEGLKER